MGLEAGTRLGLYEVRSKIGEGGMGEVYRARDTQLGRDVAVKVLPRAFAEESDRLRRFEQEAQAAGALNHPNVLVIHHVGTHGGAPYIVSELLEGETLRERLGGSALPVRRAVEYALEIARGLAAAHERGIVHRDLKPENVFVTADGRVKILDFGLAKLTEADGERARTDLPTRRVNTDSGAVMGTVGYMSPEQLRGRPVDARTDIFSFGAVLYEMLSGRHAFQRDSAADTVSAILREDPPEISETNPNVNPALDRIVRRCLEKNREARFHSASDLAFALEALSGTQVSLSGAQAAGASATGATAATATAEVSKPATRRAWLGRAGWIAAAVFLVSTLALTALHLRRAEPRAEAVRFTLPAPEKAAYGEALALSPDGRRLAYVVNRAAGGRTLWVRPLDSVAGRELAGTEGAEFPFWSPDGRHLGFYAGNRLKKIDAAGGPAQVIAEASAEARGGAWGDDGTIIFSPSITGPLLKVSASGGAATPATELDSSRGQTSHRWPAFLPGGRRFLYFGRGDRKEAQGVYAGSLDSKESKFILHTEVLAVFVPGAPNSSAGHLLFVRGKTIAAQPFDADRLELSGEPVTLADGVLNYPSEGGPSHYACFSASANGHLAYLSGDTLLTQLAWHDRSGSSAVAVGPASFYYEPSMSPDGKKIAAGRYAEGSGPQDIWVLDVARGALTRFTFDPAIDVCPLWSPDGARIIFSSNRRGRQEIYLKVSTGAGNDELLLPWEHSAYADSLTPDGRFLLFEADDPKTRFDLWLLPLEGERKPAPFLQTEFNETHAQFSPDGRWVAYTSDESGRPEVYVRSFPDRGGKWQVSTSGGDQAQWRRDGREIFYMSPEKKLMAVTVAAGDSFEAGAPAELFQTRIPSTSLTGDRNHYLAAPDGKRFLVNNLVSEGNTQPITVVLNWAADLKR
jgi:Tol biopolymer transport system component/preprotein translocase subunit SecG